MGRDMVPLGSRKAFIQCRWRVEMTRGWVGQLEGIYAENTGKPSKGLK